MKSSGWPWAPMPIAAMPRRRPTRPGGWCWNGGLSSMPDSADTRNAGRSDVLIIACGALAREITALKRQHGWEHVYLQCLDARLHNHPQQIPLRLREKIRQNRNRFDHIFVAYADCGTAGV